MGTRLTLQRLGVLTVASLLAHCAGADGGDGGGAGAEKDVVAQDSAAQDGTATLDAGSTDSDAGTGTLDAGADAGGTGDAGTPCVPVAEACDGKDNDCDGKTDEADDGPLCKVDSGQFCALEVCHAGSCQLAGVVAAPCDDLNPCTSGEACIPGSGPCPPNVPNCKKQLPACVGGKPITCNDEDPCTTDSCDKSKGCVTAPLVCNDNIVCTNDSCDAATGCVSAPAEGSCDDGSVCSEGDACAAGACKAGVTAKNCDDANACTSDSCDPKTGCKHGPLTGAACDDGSQCTTEACAAGVCKPAQKVCDDKGPCTTDSCDVATGCATAPIADCKGCVDKAACDDQNLCTTDACTGGKCANAPIAGCKGPTDYTIVKLTLAAPTFDATQGLSAFQLVIGNPFNTAPNTASTLALWLSPTEGKGEGAVKVHEVPGPIIGDITTPATLTFNVSVNHQFFGPKLPNGVANMKYACFELTVASDTVPGNNVTCVAIVPHVPDAAVQSLTHLLDGAPLEGKSFEFGNQNVAIKAPAKNSGSFVLGPFNLAQFFYATDAKGTTGVIGVGTKTAGPGNNHIQLGKIADFTFQATLNKPQLPIGPGYLCVRIASDLMPAGWAPTPDDDVKCAAITLKKSPDLSVSAIKAPTPQQGVTLGTKFQCKFEVSNGGLGAASVSKASCALSIAGANTPTWTGSVDISQLPSGGAAQLELPFVTLMPELIAGAKLGQGALKFCATVDSEAKVEESNEANNSLCQDVSLFAQDLTVTDGQVGPSLTSVARGKALDLAKMTVRNIGNAASSANYGFQVLLSKDNAVSADDVAHRRRAQLGAHRAESGAALGPSSWRTARRTTPTAQARRVPSSEATRAAVCSRREPVVPPERVDPVEEHRQIAGH